MSNKVNITTCTPTPSKRNVMGKSVTSFVYVNCSIGTNCTSDSNCKQGLCCANAYSMASSLYKYCALQNGFYTVYIPNDVFTNCGIGSMFCADPSLYNNSTLS